MNTIEFYLDTAKEKNNLKSDRALARFLNVGSTTVQNWRLERNVPNETTVTKLADIANVSHEQALLELAYWRADTVTQNVYENILKKVINVTLFAAIISVFFTISPTKSMASPILDTREKVSLCKTYTVYYGK